MGLFSSLKDLAAPLIGGGAGFLVGGPIGAAIGAGLGSNITATNKQLDASSSAANAYRYGADQSAAVQQYMFDKMLQMQRPYQEAGTVALGKLQQGDFTSDTEGYMNQLEALPTLEMPTLDENDPAYQWRKQQMEKTINQAAAARGNYNSRPTINALAEGNLALTADEIDRQFSAAKDVYASQYGKLTDLYNMSNQLGITDYNKLLDLVKIGQGSASSAGSGALATGQGLSSTYSDLASALGQTSLLKGQSESDFYSGLGAMPLNYMLMNKLLQ